VKVAIVPTLHDPLTLTAPEAWRDASSGLESGACINSGRVSSLSRSLAAAAAVVLAASLAVAAGAATPAQRTLKLGHSVSIKGFPWRCYSHGSRSALEVSCDGTNGPVVFIKGGGRPEFSIYTIEAVRVRPAAAAAARHVYRFAAGPPAPPAQPGEKASVVHAGESLVFAGLPAWRCDSVRLPASFRCQLGTKLLVTLGSDGVLTVSSERPARVSGPADGRAYVWS
jgi:hypothetical protein